MVANTHSPSNIEGTKVKASPWPLAIIVFFVVVAIFNFVFVRLALNSSVPPISDHPYEDGLKYQGVIDAKNRSRALGLKTRYTFSDVDASGDRSVSVEIRDHNETPVKDAKITMRAFRFSEASMDFVATLTEDSKAQPGRYSAKLHLPRSGLWLFELNLSLAGTDYFLDSKEMIP